MVKRNDRWSALSMSEKAEIFKMGVKNGIKNRKTIIDVYNSFGDGGDTKSIENTPIKPTLKEFLQAKADSTRNAALEKSRTRTEGVEIVYPLAKENKNSNLKTVQEYYFANPDFIGPLTEYQQDPYFRTLYYQAKKELDNNCDYGDNCIGTATDNYPEDSRANVNAEFRENPFKYGFVDIPYEEMLPGDIVQVDNHGMIFDSFEEGKPLFNYSNGYIGPDAYRKKGKYPVHKNFYSVFRYKGTPTLIQQWTEEYNKTYNKASGGKINKFKSNRILDGTEEEQTLSGLPIPGLTEWFDTYMVNSTKFSAVPEAPIDEDELAKRQAWAESAGNDKAGSHKGAKGRYQIMPNTLTEYQTVTRDIGDIYDPVYNRRVRDWEFNRYKDSDQVNRGEPTDSVKMGRRLAIYNYGYGNTRKALNRADSLGIDTDNSFDWLQEFPKETQDYVNFILRGKNTGSHRTNSAYKNRKK